MTLRCSQCKRRVIEKSGEGAIVRAQGKIVFADGVCTAQCFFCKSQITLPLELSKAIPDEPRLVIPARRNGS